MLVIVAGLLLVARLSMYCLYFIFVECLRLDCAELEMWTCDELLHLVECLVLTISIILKLWKRCYFQCLLEPLSIAEMGRHEVGASCVAISKAVVPQSQIRCPIWTLRLLVCAFVDILHSLVPCLFRAILTWTISSDCSHKRLPAHQAAPIWSSFSDFPLRKS